MVRTHLRRQLARGESSPLLDEALGEARRDPLPEYAQRVGFLRLGLEHAQRTVRLASLFDESRNVSPDRLGEAKKALAELVQFRKEHERRYFVGRLWVANFWERPRLNVDALLESR